MVLGSLWLTGCGSPVAANAIIVQSAGVPPGAVSSTELSAWYPLLNSHPWPGEMLLAAAPVAQQPIRLVVTGYDTTEAEYFQMLLAAAESGRAPDVAYLSTSDNIRRAVATGLVAPLNDCRATYPAFEPVRNEMWLRVTGHGETWAVPVAMSSNILFYDKEKLRALGWSAAEINSLPARVATGTFTWSDLRDTAADALAADVVRPGYGFSQTPADHTRITSHYMAYGGRIYDPTRDRLVIDRAALVQAYAFRRDLLADDLTLPFVLDGAQNTWSARALWHDAIAHSTVLFWIGRSTDWEKWQAIAAGVGGGAPAQADATGERWGLARVPSAVPGQPPRLVEASASYFVILNERATGRQNQHAACALLAAAITPAINGPTVAGSGWFAVVDAAGHDMVGQQADEAVHLLDAAGALLDGTAVMPSVVDHDLSLYEDVLTEFAQQAQTGQMTPDEAAAAAVRQLRLALGDDLIVE